MARITATVYIHGGDYDCSEAVRMCYRAVGVLPFGSYMWTGNEVELLKEYGFIEVGLFERIEGDVLWKPGHTEMYLGNGYQGGARLDETGGVHGYAQGDQTGNEVARSRYDQSYWKWQKCLRYAGPVTVGGIPANIAAAQVMNHLIDHPAHGYSQDNRKGDGTIEAVQITWDDGNAGFIPVDSPFDFTFNRRVRVRTAPEVTAATFQGVWWEKGQTATFDGIAFGDGYTWGTYIGPATGKRLYSAMGTHEYGAAQT